MSVFRLPDTSHKILLIVVLNYKGRDFPCKHLKTAQECKYWVINSKKWMQSSSVEDRTHPKSVLLRFVGHSDRWGGTHFIITNWNQNTKGRRFNVAPMGLPRHQHIPNGSVWPNEIQFTLYRGCNFQFQKAPKSTRVLPVRIRENTDQDNVDITPTLQMRNIWVPGVLGWVISTPSLLLEFSEIYWAKQG